MPRCLVIGFGNALRSDDGAGFKAAVLLEAELSSPTVSVIATHQLTPELAEPVARALEELEVMGWDVERIQPYQFSIRVSDVLRRYVTEQFDLPVTKQTSVEFLTAMANASPFSAEEKTLLEDFLNRCDLIKFARYDATAEDSRLLLEEAIRFVKGGELGMEVIPSGGTACPPWREESRDSNYR